MLLRAAFVTTFILVLAACGGGGGGGGGSSSNSSSGPSFTLSGTISIPETADVDSDSNDPNQVPWIINDTLALSQPITTPVQLIGSVNVPNAGPPGPNFSSGDYDDVFTVTLAQGQLIELEFANDVAQNDIDLFLYDPNLGTVVGQSISTSTQLECIRVGRTGTYNIVVDAYSGASIYNLRVGAPGDGGSCATTSTDFNPIVDGQIVSRAAPGASTTRLAQNLHGLGARIDGPLTRPQLTRLPAAAGQRIKALRALQIENGQSPAASTTRRVARDANLASTIDTVHFAKTLARNPAYSWAEPNYRMQRRTLVGTLPPSDTEYLKQRWHYEQINLPAALERITALSPQPLVRPLVAVIDDGIVGNHPDLVNQIEGGYSFISNVSVGDGNTPNPEDPSTSADSPYWHGTHVAGTVAAEGFNAKYGTGVAPMARIMPLRVFSPAYDGASSYDILQAIYYAARLPNNSNSLPARRADVINMSLGGAQSCPNAYLDAVTQARAQGVIVVAASGNDARNNLGQTAAVGAPANCAGVIAVGATDARKLQTFYSNSGSALDLVAPGGDLYQSTTGTGLPDGIYSTLATFNSSGTRVPSFGPMPGTSMAAPHVAGVIALMRYVHPGITPAQVDTLIQLGVLTDDLGNVGRDNATGYGLINARKAVDEAIALANGNSTAPAGIVVATPSSIDFGSLSSSANLSLTTTAATSETVTGITPSTAAVTVTPININGAGLGSYTVSVDRSSLPIGNSFPTITVTTSTRSFTVQLSINKSASGGLLINADFGTVYVLAVDPQSGNVLQQSMVTVTNGQYVWSMPGVPAGQIELSAGTDLDNDGLLCQRGEACGAYPLLGNSATTINVTGNMSGLDFPITPLGAHSTSSLRLGGGATGRSRLPRRLP